MKVTLYRSRLVIAILALTLGACDAQRSSTAPLSQRVGQQVNFTGMAANAKLGAMLMVNRPRSIVWIEKMSSWPSGVAGKQVRVTGKLIRKSDLPVFVVKPGEPARSGIPVPPGADIKKAAMRYLIQNASWTLVK